MPHHPVVLIHGYSDVGQSFEPWARRLEALGYDIRTIHTANYRTLTNEVSIRDIAEGFDRALRIRAGLDHDEPFDAIVHSTGMLVARAWLTTYAHRRGRLKHLIGLAPASFGSPLAHKGRSWLGSIFKGSREVGPDFLEAGDRVLDGLELGSTFTWDLAHRDLLSERQGDPPFYGGDDGTPYVFVFCGTSGYGGVRGIVNEPGTDGTVRLAGCALYTRKIILDLTKNPDLTRPEDRVSIQPWSNIDIPLIPVRDRNHGSILADPPDDLVDMVAGALNVTTEAEYRAWLADSRQRARGALEDVSPFQQFIVRAVDERGDPVTDYNLQLFGKQAGSLDDLLPFDTDVHAYSGDESLRCFHVELSEKLDQVQELWLRITVSSGTQLVGYYGVTGASLAPGHPDDRQRPVGWWEGWLDVSPLLTNDRVKFFWPFTTTLAEVRIKREPMPLDPARPNEVLDWVSLT